MTYRVILAAATAAKFYHLPKHARDALVARVTDLVERPWDDARVLHGDDPTFRGTTFGDGRGMLEFHVDEGVVRTPGRNRSLLECVRGRCGRVGGVL